MFSPKTVLITGCSRGIGLGYVKHLLKLGSPPTHIFATCRSPNNAKELGEIAAANPSVYVVQLDVTDATSIDSARQIVEEKLDGKGLNLLINNAGIDVTRGIHDVKVDEMVDHFKTNCVGPLLVTRAFLPLLQQAATANSQLPMSCSRAAIVNISSDWGSIAENNFSGEIPYKVSKAGLNMVSANLTIELKPAGILVTSIDPGNAQTDMGGPHASVPLNESVIGVLKTLATLQGEESTGRFLNYKGETLHW